MILHPSVLALTIASLLTTFMVLSGALFGAAIIRRWDLQSGSETQLTLERRTYLISTLVGYACGFQVLSLFLFVFTADDLCGLFTGAMCAAGTLKVNSWGYPTLLLKIVNFLLASIWLVLNRADNSAPDYPLIRKKYLLLILAAPLMAAETVIQLRYFAGLHPDIITSCCGTLFSAEAPEAGPALSSIASYPMAQPFFVFMGLTIASGLFVYRKQGSGGALFAVMALAAFVVSLLAVISTFSPYIYELPTHHCPFCLLQGEYNYLGYPLYLFLFAGAAAGAGAGVLAPFRHLGSLSDVIPPMQQRLALLSIVCYSLFTAVIIASMAASNLRLD